MRSRRRCHRRLQRVVFQLRLRAVRERRLPAHSFLLAGRGGTGQGRGPFHGHVFFFFGVFSGGEFVDAVGGLA